MMVGQLAERQSVGAPPLVYTAGKSVERQSAPQMMTFESANPLGGQLAKKEATKVIFSLHKKGQSAL